MNLPVQSQPVMRNTSTAAISNLNAINASFDYPCVIDCAAGLAKCAFSPNPVQCLIDAGLSKCVRCL